MLVKIRLTRMGAVKRPFYRIVVADSRNARDGKYIENLGTYDPRTDPSSITLNEDKALGWLQKGAQPSAAVTKLLKIKGVWQRFEESKAR
jgi:small subunit ribosomal protein S16